MPRNEMDILWYDCFVFTRMFTRMWNCKLPTFYTDFYLLKPVTGLFIFSPFSRDTESIGYQLHETECIGSLAPVVVAVEKVIYWLAQCIQVQGHSTKDAEDVSLRWGWVSLEGPRLLEPDLRSPTVSPDAWPLMPTRVEARSSQPALISSESMPTDSSTVMLSRGFKVFLNPVRWTLWNWLSQEEMTVVLDICSS